MVNLGLTKVDDALVAKHPVGFVFVFMRFYYLCTVEDTVPLHTWKQLLTLIQQKCVTQVRAVFICCLSGFGELRRLSVSCFHEGVWDLCAG